MTGPLAGLTVLEVGGIGPLPLFGMLLADLGARVVRIDRLAPGPRTDPKIWMFRGRESLTLDTRRPAGRDALLRLVEQADVLVEGFRPGVMERLGIGPDTCLARNPRLVYGRMTGWGGNGPLAYKGGHDLNYVAISGALGAIGPKDRPPTVPLNLIGDYGGGTMMLALGVLAALEERHRSGAGQVVEVGMSDGVLALMSQWYSMRAAGSWTDERDANLIDGGSPFYRCYETSDHRYVAVGAIEPQFYAALLDGLRLDPGLAATQHDKARFPAMHALFAETFATRTRDEWETVFATRDGCVTPVLTMAEAPSYAHNAERGAFVTANGEEQIAPPVRFGRTPAAIGGPARAPGADNDQVLRSFGFDETEIAELRAADVVGARP